MQSGILTSKNHQIGIDERLKFLRLFNQAKFEKNPYAQRKVADGYYYGNGTEKDEKKAVEWYLMAADQGELQAQNTLATCFEDGIGIEKDEVKAIYWHRKAAEQGSAIAQFNLGYNYEHGIGVAKDEKQAVELYFGAAKQGHVGAQNNLAKCLDYGTGVKENKIEAIKWYRKAAKQGNAQAQCNLGKCYANSTPQDYIRAVKYFTLAAKQGFAEAQFQLALCLENGNGVEKNEKNAAKWYYEAAQQGYVDAQVNLAVCFENGTGVEKNEKRAIKWHQLAASQGNALAQYNLGYCFAYGIGVEKDIKQAIKWYQLAADQKHSSAQTTLAFLFLKSMDVERDAKKAEELFQQASENGNSRARLWCQGKISIKSNPILQAAKESKNGYVPCEFPPLIDQQGPYCGSAALAGAINYSKFCPKTLYASHYEKLRALGESSLHDSSDVVLEALKKTSYSSDGAQYNVYSFKEVAKIYDIEGEAIVKESYSEEEYTQTICSALKQNYVLILACDSKNYMPKQKNGMCTHWVAAFGYWSDKNNQYKLLVNHHGLYCEWDMHDLYESNLHMPINNPLAPGDLKNFRFSFFKVPIKEAPPAIIDGAAVRPKAL